MKTFITGLFIVLFLSIIYLLTLKGIPGNPDAKSINDKFNTSTMPFELSPERGRYALMLAIAEDKSFELKGDIAKMALPDLGYFQGKYYSLFSPGVSVLILPFYYLGKQMNLTQVISFSFSSFFAVMNGLFIYLILKKFSVNRYNAVLSAIIFAFATTSWPYAVTLYQHHITTFFMLSGFYYVIKFKEHEQFYWFWGVLVWLNFGLAFVVDSPNLILLFPLIIFYLISSIKFKKNKNQMKIKFQLQFIYSIFIFIFIMFLYGLYNNINFGNFTKLSGSIPRIQNINDGEIIGGADLQGKKKNIFGFFKAQNIPRGLYTLLLSDERGLFFYIPIMAISILGVIKLYFIRKTETIILAQFVIFNIFLYSAFSDPWGGWAFGPRYLIPSMAVLSIFLGVTFNFYKNILLKIISFPLILYSIIVSLSGALTTVQVPPKSEAVVLNIGHNFIYNLKFLFANKSSSFIYNYYLKNYLSLPEFALILFAVISLTIFYFLFISPLFERNVFWKKS